MSEPIDAIYEDGVLKPLVPLALPERTQVKVTVSEPQGGAAEGITERKAALKQLWAKIDQLPRAQSTKQAEKDEWSVARNHDDILYCNTSFGPEQRPPKADEDSESES